MNSFLEKLQKGMAGQAAATESHPEDATPENLPAAPENAAVFAAYSADSKTKQKKRGIPTLDDSAIPRPQTNKIITAENVDQMPEIKSDLAKTSKSPDKKNKEKTSSKKNRKINMANKKNPVQSWLNREEAQLAVNVYQTEMDLVLQAALAGVKVENLDVLIEDEVITIKGERPDPLPESGDYFVEECYFGPFSRKIILPVEVDSGRADAMMKDGILTIRIPKIVHEKKKKVEIKA